MIILELVIFLMLLFALAGFAYASVLAAPWLPLPKKDILRMITLAGLKPNDIVYDLGCGDGRVLIQVARTTGARAIGFEISLVMYLIARLRVYFSGQRDRIKVYYQNFYHEDLAKADVIFCFLTTYAMRRLTEKVKQELKPGAKFLSYAFPLVGLVHKIAKKDLPADVTIYFYQPE